MLVRLSGTCVAAFVLVTALSGCGGGRFESQPLTSTPPSSGTPDQPVTRAMPNVAENHASQPRNANGQPRTITVESRAVRGVVQVPSNADVLSSTSRWRYLGPPVSIITDIVPNRSTWVRTDDSPTDVVYDPSRQLVYTSNTRFNRVEIISATSATLLQTIAVPQPMGLDITADGAFLYVGTQTQQMYRIDLARLEVVEAIPLPFAAFGVTTPLPERLTTLASGKVLVQMGDFSTASGLAEYDPATRTFTTLPLPQPTMSAGLMIRSGDHSKVLVGDNASGGNIALFDSAADSFVATNQFFGSFVWPMAANSSGTQFALQAACCQWMLLDQNLNVLSSHTDNMTFLSMGAAYSRNDRWIFIPQRNASTNSPLIAVIDGRSFATMGYIPDLLTAGHPARPTIHAVTDNGFLLGSAERGLSFVDATVPPGYLREPAPRLSFGGLNPPLQPSHVTAGNLQTTLNGGYFQAPPAISFGANPGSAISYVSQNQIRVTAPPSAAPSPVNVRALFPGGYFTLAPDGYSYAPLARYANADSGDLSGGTAVTVQGYALGYSTTQMSVTVGGVPATVTGTASGISWSPFSLPVQTVSFTTPATSVPVDTAMVINTPDGTTSLPYHYVRKTLWGVLGMRQLVLDEARNKLYATDLPNNQVQVRALDTGAVSTIPVGVGPIGAALTPDGSRLIVGNFWDKTVSLIDPDTRVTQTVSVDNGDTTINPRPFTVAALANGSAFIGMDSIDAFGCVGVLQQLDLATLAVKTRPFLWGACEDQSFLVAGSADGTTALVGTLAWHSSTDTFTAAPFGLIQDNTIRAVSEKGEVLSAFRILYDTNLRADWIVDWPELLDCRGCDFWGEKLHASGALFYLAVSDPGFHGKDTLQIFDAHTGMPVRMIDMPEKWATNALDTLAINRKGDKIYAITQAGVVQIELPSVPLSIGTLSPNNGTSGTAITVNGSGFISGATVTIGGQPATATFLDSNTLTVSAPSLAPGTYRMTVTIPGGRSYSLDAAYTAN